MIVEVTAEDISAGNVRSAVGCPVGLAVARTLGIPVESVRVGRRYVVVINVVRDVLGTRNEVSRQWEFKTQTDADQFISAFDLGVKVAPRRFELLEVG